jgi:hypothetical protein
MSKLILLSIMLGMITIPTRAARDPNPRRGLKKALKQVLIFEAFYTFALLFLWGRF